MTYSKEDVEFHSDGFRPSRPAVNVKVYGSISNVPLPLDLGRYSDDGGKTWKESRTDSEFTHEWLEEHLAEDVELFNYACENGWNMLQEEAVEIFGKSIYGKPITVYSEGRSGGWAIVDGLPEFESWNAVDLMRWRRFEIFAKATADDIPRQIIELAYFNVFLPWKEEREDARPDETDPMIERELAQ